LPTYGGRIIAPGTDLGAESFPGTSSPLDSLGIIAVYFEGLENQLASSGKSEIEYWFNLKTRAVEVGPQSLSIDRVGPFASESEAKNAEAIIAERAAKIRAEDEAEQG
jgi:hypothetical protein